MRKCRARFAEPFHTRCAEHMPAGQWVLGYLHETSKAGGSTEERLRLGVTHVAVEAFDVGSMYLGGHFHLIGHPKQIHLRAKFVVRANEGRLEVLDPILGQFIGGEICCLRP